ncbi:MAG: tetratricopeptide repeat protein [Polyangiaceae bacterium]|jgi:tetratricopeptide (TPR) repeat protein|nr:tetratricopeptide repeat protein [Polyangiaceae bacterium]
MVVNTGVGYPRSPMATDYYAVATRDRRKLENILEGQPTVGTDLDPVTLVGQLQERVKLQEDESGRLLWRGTAGGHLQVTVARRMLQVSCSSDEDPLLLERFQELLRALQDSGLHVWDPRRKSWLPGDTEETRWWGLIEAKDTAVELRREALEKLGDRLFEKKRYAQAIPLMEEALALRPVLSRMSRLAMALDQLPNPDHERRIALLLASSATNPWWGDYRNASIAAEKLGDLDRAIAFEIFAWRTMPDKKAPTRLVRLLRQGGSAEASLAFARDIFRHIGEDDPWSWQQLISALGASNDSAEGLAVARKAEARHPGQCTRDLSTMLDQHARSLADQGQARAGRELVDEMVALASNATNHHRAGNFYFYRLHDDLRGLEHYRRGLALVPADPFLQASLGILRYRRREYEQAEELLRQAFEADPSYGYRGFHYANCLLERRRFVQAEEVAFLSIELSSQPVEGLHLLGHLYHPVGLLEDASQAFQAAVRCNPGFTKLHHDLFRVALDRGDVEAARGHLEDGLRHDPSCKHCSIGFIELALHLGQIEEAERLLATMREKDPENTDLLELAGRCSAAGQNLEVAEKYLRGVTRARPFHDGAWLELGKVLLARGRRQEAIQALETSLQQNGNLDRTRFEVLETALRDAGDPRATEVGSLRAAFDAELAAGRAAVQGFSKAPRWKSPAQAASPRAPMPADRTDMAFEQAVLLLELLALTPEMQAAIEREEHGLDLSAMRQRLHYITLLDPTGSGPQVLPYRARMRGLRWGEQLIEQLEIDTRRLRGAGVRLFATSPAWLPRRIACELDPLRLCLPLLGHRPPAYSILDLVDCAHQFPTFEEEMKRLDRWEETVWLRCENNDMHALPAPQLPLPRLRVAGFAGNQLSAIPPALATCKTLEVVDLSRNPISKLPADLSRLRHLRYLDLTRTSLSVSQIHKLRTELPDCHVKS